MSKLMGLRDALTKIDLDSISSDLTLEGNYLSREVVKGDEKIMLELRRYDFPEVKTHSFHFKVFSDKNCEGFYRTFCKNSLDKAIRVYQFVINYVGGEVRE